MIGIDAVHDACIAVAAARAAGRSCACSSSRLSCWAEGRQKVALGGPGQRRWVGVEMLGAPQQQRRQRKTALSRELLPPNRSVREAGASPANRSLRFARHTYFCQPAHAVPQPHLGPFCSRCAQHPGQAEAGRCRAAHDRPGRRHHRQRRVQAGVHHPRAHHRGEARPASAALCVSLSDDLADRDVAQLHAPRC
jgi:hypothetical protein